MTLNNQIQKFGSFLFKWRSYLPLILITISALYLSLYRQPSYELRNIYLWRTVACVFIILGMAIRCLTIGYIPKGTSGRNTKTQKASVLNTDGMYSIVRNPLYTGNILMWLGIMMVFENVAILLISIILLLGYYFFIIFTEETFLTSKFQQEYLQYAQKTPCVIPRPQLWTNPHRQFSWRMLLKREPDSFFSGITGLVIAVHYIDFINHGTFTFRRDWLVAWLTCFFLWICVKIPKKLHWI